MLLTRNQLLTDVWDRPYADEVHDLHARMVQLHRTIQNNPTRRGPVSPSRPLGTGSGAGRPSLHRVDERGEG